MSEGKGDEKAVWILAGEHEWTARIAKHRNRIFNQLVSDLAEKAALSGPLIPIFDPDKINGPDK